MDSQIASVQRRRVTVRFVVKLGCGLSAWALITAMVTLEFVPNRAALRGESDINEPAAPIKEIDARGPWRRSDIRCGKKQRPRCLPRFKGNRLVDLRDNSSHGALRAWQS
jgi:hypothetical protein